MLLAMKIKLAMAATVVAAPIAFTGPPAASLDQAQPANAIFVDIATATFDYRLAGDFSLDGKPAAAPVRTMRLSKTLRIMNRQVTAGEYAACVADGACPRVASKRGMDERPVVGVSWRDATAYAEWITKTTGVLHRLPTDEEWVFAAGGKAADEPLPLVDPADPAQAWIARYEAEADRKRPLELGPQPVGTFGRNERGLQDVGGNVWEWTNTCFLRFAIEPGGGASVVNTNCGVRVVQGAHRTYMTDFIRDPRTGGCAAGVPPANLGFRLVVEDEKLPVLNRMVERVAARVAVALR